MAWRSATVPALGGAALMTVFLLVPASLMGQHPGGSTLTQSPGSCQMCHVDHGVGTFGTLDMPGGLDESTANCLACHTSTTERARHMRGNWQGNPSAGPNTYLGLDLSDDHFVGKRSEGSGALMQDRLNSIRYARPASSMGVFGATGGDVQCMSCHDPHTPNPEINDADGQQMLCSTCHEPAAYVTPSHSSSTCSDCHQLHGSVGPVRLAASDSDVLCQSCHGGARLSSWKPPAPRGPDGPPGHLEPMTDRCVGCHPVHEPAVFN